MTIVHPADINDKTIGQSVYPMIQSMQWLVFLAALGFTIAATDVLAAPATDKFEGANSGSPPAAAAPRIPRIEGGQVNGHWREGTRLIGQPGQFKITGDRLSFTSADGSLHFDCLENLCSQRIARTTADSPEALSWSVTGELTEYRGTNFLLLTQAVLKPKATRSPPAP